LRHPEGVAFKRFIVGALNRLCTWVDELAYRPAVVKLTLPLPRWWSCQLSKLSIHLDGRWATGYWSNWGIGGICDVCGRRAAWFVVGGIADDDGIGGEPFEPARHHAEENYGFMARHPINLCGWCRLDSEAFPIESAEELEREIVKAKARSISWRWS
jgi:hypothetical protein